MTIEQIDFIVRESGALAGNITEDPRTPEVLSQISVQAQLMQVKMLAEIAKQLAILNRGNGVGDDCV